MKNGVFTAWAWLLLTAAAPVLCADLQVTKVGDSVADAEALTIREPTYSHEHYATGRRHAVHASRPAGAGDDPSGRVIDET